MSRAVLTALPLAVVGVVLIALPDSGPRLFSFSREHGPGPVDALGALLLILAWLLLARQTWLRRDRLVRYASRPAFQAGVFGLGFGAGLVVASAVGDFAGWWAVGAALLVLVQLPAFVVASRRSGPDRRW